MKPSEVKAHWEDWARRFGGDLRATTRTPTAKRLEIDALLRALRTLSFDDTTQARVLEVGCGNGYNAIAIAETFARANVTGIDYVDDMVAHARANGLASRASERLAFHAGDVTQLDAVPNLAATYDVIVSNRCLINLGSTPRQIATLSRLAERTAGDGALLLIENSQQSFARQNQCRVAMGLEAREPSAFNHFLDEAVVVPHLRNRFESVSIEDFGSLHDLLLYVLVPASNGGTVDYDHPLVEAATAFSLAQVDGFDRAFGSVGQNRLFVCRGPKPSPPR